MDRYAHVADELLVKAKIRLEQWIDLNNIRKKLLVNFDFNPMNSY